MLKIKITGASGYLGNLISNELTKKGYQVSGIKRELLYTDITTLKNEIAACDVLINLAGVPILKRWTNKNKNHIYESRVQTTKNLVKAINSLPQTAQPKKFISASAIGIYKAGETHDENSQNFDVGFVGKVVKDWENASVNLPLNVQRNILRIGLVLGKKAKTITNLLLPFKLGLGGTIGNGKQAFPFIHEKDLVRAFIWAIEDFAEDGTFNLVVPQKITNKDFTKTLAKVLKRPTIFSIPAFILKIVLGEAAVLLTEAPEVKPKKLIDAGFTFEYSTIEETIAEIVQ